MKKEWLRTEDFRWHDELLWEIEGTYWWFWHQYNPGYSSPWIGFTHTVHKTDTHPRLRLAGWLSDINIICSGYQAYGTTEQCQEVWNQLIDNPLPFIMVRELK